MDAGHGDELVLVARRPRLALEFGNGGVVQVLLSVEGRRAVLRQQLVRVFLLDRLGEVACFVQVGPGSFAPDHVGVPEVTGSGPARAVGWLVGRCAKKWREYIWPISDAGERL